MYAKQPGHSEQELADMRALGLRPEDFPQQTECLVWPDNWPAVRFFERISLGCWEFRGADPMGLRYEALREVRLALGITAKQWRGGLFDDIQVMEDEAVKVLRGIQ
jgi:ribosomal protein S18 acetylase RimI-like enzyme